MSILWGESAVTNMLLWVWNKSFLSLWVEPVEGMLICRWGANCHGSEKLVARALARDRFLAVRIHCGLLFAKREFHVKNIVFPGICSILVIHYLNGTSQFVLQSKSHYRKFLQNCGLYWGLWASKLDPASHHVWGCNNQTHVPLCWQVFQAALSRCIEPAAGDGPLPHAASAPALWLPAEEEGKETSTLNRPQDLQGWKRETMTSRYTTGQKF